MTEHQLQQQIVKYWNTNYPKYRKCLFHVEQSAKNGIQGSIQKALGVVSGVSDLILVLNGKVLFLEVKTETGKQSPHQIEFQDQVSSLGHEYAIIRSLDDFILILLANGLK